MLKYINGPGDIKKIPENRLYDLAEEIRGFLIGTISKTGGHLASNLGVVELTIALHRVYDSEKDKIIWDVGHQCYTHKLLTGRKNEFSALRKKGGISGFPRRSESECDCFDTGHSSNSISAGLGFVSARDITGEDYKVVSVIGDGALTGGEAFEALNNASQLHKNFVVILNDNTMSISRNVGGISDYLDRVRVSENYTGMKMSISSGLGKIPVIGQKMINDIRTAKSSLKHLFIPGMLFEDMGFTYLGPIDGHNIMQMEKVLREAKEFSGPVLVHVVTEKGKGYLPAQKNPERFHGTPSFSVIDGKPVKEKKETYTEVFAAKLCDIARDDPKVTAITAAMKEGTGLKRFQSLYPQRFFDVGIAEQHAVTFAAAQALGGLKPVAAIYSSFLQRAYDQVMLDICAQKAPVVLAIDRAGFVGEDGRTHQGCFDIAYLSMMPDMTVMAPKDAEELRNMLEFAVNYDGPAAIRYSKGEITNRFAQNECPTIEYGRAEIIRKGKTLAILAEGAMVSEADRLCELLSEKGIEATLVNARFIKPFDKEIIRSLAKDHTMLLTVEDGIKSGGFGEHILDFVNEEKLGMNVIIAAVDDMFVGHGSVRQQMEETVLSAEGMLERVLKELNQ